MTVASKVKQTIANLKGVQSTLRLYSIQAQKTEARNAYKEAIQVTGEVINDLENRVKDIEFREPQYKEK